jgi:outer membrane protein, heavy metal efflux system
MRLHLSKLIVFGLIFLPLSAAAAGPVVTLDELVEEALTANPQIAAARQDAAAARQQVPQAGALEDPMLGFGVLNVPDNFDFGMEDMTTKEITLSQKVPFFGKRQLMRQMAERMADSARAGTDNAAAQVIGNVRSTFYDLSHVHRTIEVTERNKAVLGDFSRLAQTRYGVGQGIQEDVIRVQVEISRMIDELQMLEQRRRSLEARMNALLNRPSAQVLGVPAQVDFESYRLDIEQVQQSALSTSPMLRAMQSEVSARQSAVSLANRERYPDFNFRVGYGQRENRGDMYSAMVEINLPVFSKSKQNRRVDEAAAELSAQESRFNAARNELFYMIADMGSMAQRLERQIELYRTGIIPQATLQVQSAMSAYRVDRADFMTLLDSRMRLYNFELDYHQAITDYAKSIASLEAATGAPLERSKQ